MTETEPASPAGRRRAIIVDIDGTLCPIKRAEERYADLVPYALMIDVLRRYQDEGWAIVLHTSRNMNSFGGNVGRINAETAPVLLEWLKRWGVPFDEVYFGKPWPGHEGFYVEDRAVRPDEFLRHTAAEIEEIIERGRKTLGGA